MGYHLVPHWDGRETEFWNCGRVWWGRCYWVTMGVSVVKSLPERRIAQVDIVLITHKYNPYRRQSDGTRQTDSRRASED